MADIQTTVIKRSPIVPLWTFLVIEVLAILIFFIAAQFDTLKFQVYSFIPISSFLSYEMTKFFILSIIQFVITVYVFLRWYYESYAVRSGSLTHHWGVFFKKEKTFSLSPSMSIAISRGPLGRRLRYGSVSIDNTLKKPLVVLAHVSRPDDVVRTLKRFLHQGHGDFRKEPDAMKLLRGEEHELLEFKSSLRFDYKSGQVNRDLEKSIMKTISAFLNTRGGHLVIGVNDKRDPLGLTKDYGTLRRSDSDGFENHFTQIFNSAIGPEFRHLVKLWFPIVGDNTICVVQAVSSPRPVYLKLDNNEHFYVRTGNVSTPLRMSEVEAYRKSRWPSRLVRGA